MHKKNSKAFQQWKKRWFVLAVDAEKGYATLKYYTDSTLSDLKGEHIITENSLIFGVSNVSGHDNCFKFVSITANDTSAEKELIMYAEAPNIKMKWIYAIESFIHEAKQNVERIKFAEKMPKTTKVAIGRQPSHLSSKSIGSVSSGSSNVLEGDEEAVIKQLDAKSKSMITMVERFVKAWMEGDMTSYSTLVAAGVCAARVCVLFCFACS